MNELRGVTLRPVVRGDLPLILKLFGDVDRAHLWGQRRVCDEEQLLETWRFWSQEKMGSKFMVVRQGRPVGLVFDYERSLDDGHTKVATLLVADDTARGAGALSTLLFVQWLFQNVALRKVYFDVFEFNQSVVRMLEKLGLRKEMQRCEHRFWDGRHWDQYGFALNRGELPPVIARLTRGKPLAKHEASAVGNQPANPVQLPAARSRSQGEALADSFDAALTSLMR